MDSSDVDQQTPVDFLAVQEGLDDSQIGFESMEEGLRLLISK